MQQSASPKIACLQAVLLAALVGACAAPDSVTAPQRSASVTAPSYYQSFAGSVLTLTSDDNGVQYTLDVNAQELRFSDGRVLKLDFDQTTEALSTFHGTIVSDSVLNELGTFHAGCDDPTQLECDSSGGTSIMSTSESGFIWRFVSESDFYKKQKDGKKDKKTKGDDGGTDLMSYADVCSDVMTAALNASGYYRQRRTSIWDNAFQYAVAEAVNWAIRWLPPGSPSAVQFGGDVADHLYSRTNMSVLAFMWNSYGCGRRQVTAGPIISGSTSSSSGGSTGSLTLFCHTEYIQVSFDGGNTWHYVAANVCQYRSN